MLSGADIRNPFRQQGVALLILVIVIVLATATYFVAELSVNEIRFEQQKKTRASLKKAKQTLLAYAMNYDRTGAAASQGPGNFPCPANEEDGLSDTTTINPACNNGGDGVLGRLPYAALDIEPLYDGTGELLWYAVSNNYASYADRPINTSTTGQITVKNPDGSLRVSGASNDGIVAVIIAPGKELVRDDGINQIRLTAADKDVRNNYLDIAFAGDALEEDNADYVNADANNGFIHGPVYNAANEIIVNDQIEVITYSDIMNLVRARAANDIGNVIKEYFSRCSAFPDAADFDGDTATGAPYDSVLNQKQGMLPVGTAQPLDWDMLHPDCDLTGVIFPEWVAWEEWHLHTYYEYAYTNPVFPGGAGAVPCTQGVDCLTVFDMPAPDNNKQAIIMFAGRTLDANPVLVPPLAAQNRPSTNLQDYFESENNDGDLEYDMSPYDTELPEDYIWTILP